MAVRGSAWGTFTIAMTIPIALFIGLYMKRFRPGQVVEASIIGGVLVLAAVWLGGMIDVPDSALNTFHDYFDLSEMADNGGDGGVWICREHFAGVDFVVAAGLFVELFENWDGGVAGDGGDSGAARVAGAGDQHDVFGGRSDREGIDFSVCVYHDHVRGDFGISCVGEFRDDAEDDR